MKFIAQINEQGDGFSFGNGVDKFKEWAKKHPGMRMHIEALLPESKKQRKFYEGAVLPMIAYFQENLDHRDWRDVQRVHSWVNEEFNADCVVINGNAIKIAGSTKGKLQETINKVIDWLEENYGIDRIKVLNPSDYKHWRDAIFPYGGAAHFIDYLVETGKLKKGITEL